MSKEKKERTYSPSKVFKELKAVKWPTFKELMSSSGLVIVFTVLFGLYFFVCEFLSSGLVKMIVGCIGRKNMSELKKEWYVVNTYAGQENRVKENLERRVKTMGLEDSLFQIVVAEEKEIEYKNGKPVEKTHNLFSGYLLVQMIMTDEAWYVVRNTPGVTGFIGSSGKGAKPFPVAQEEVDAVLRRLGRQDVNVQVDFEVGDRVEITNGAFKNSEGVIEAMDEEKKEATVLLILFGRETPTEIPYMDLKKVD